MKEVRRSIGIVIEHESNLGIGHAPRWLKLTDIGTGRFIFTNLQDRRVKIENLNGTGLILIEDCNYEITMHTFILLVGNFNSD